VLSSSDIAFKYDTTKHVKQDYNHLILKYVSLLVRACG
jgi:hypothetical protein